MAHRVDRCVDDRDRHGKVIWLASFHLVDHQDGLSGALGIVVAMSKINRIGVKATEVTACVSLRGMASFATPFGVSLKVMRGKKVISRQGRT